VIDLRSLLELTTTGQPCVAIDADGALLEDLELDVSDPAVLFVAPVTDAVKVVAGGLVHDSLDRETLWAIEGFQLTREVLLALDDGVTSSQSLIDRVIEAGFQWQVITPSTGVL
jgi:2-C-methyl-D-erythritol 4-phosphate cytidylyltransferase